MSSERRLSVAVTGATGYVGRALCPPLRARGVHVRRVLRQLPPVPSSAASAEDARSGYEDVPIGDISTVLDWTPLLQGIDTVVHLASPALSPDEEDALPRFREVNVECTRRLAQGASAAGVRKFIFLSSLKVHGERSLGRPIREDDPRCPADAYAISKVEAEDALRDVSRETGLNVITLRPPAVYGPGARGNILRLLRLISRGIPLPLGSIANQRSLIYMDNLVDAIIACIDATPRPHCTYLVSDGEDVSTPDLVRRLAAALGVPARLVPCPVALLKLGARVMGRSADIGRLTESLQLDCSRIRDELGWKPPHSLAHGLQATARSFQQREEHTPIEMGAADRARARR